MRTRAYWGRDHALVQPFETDMTPGGGPQSTLADVARWLQMLAKGGVVGGKRFLTEEQYQRFLRPESTAAALAGLKRGYAKGTFSYLSTRRPYYSQGGYIDEFNSLINFHPGGKWAFAILINDNYPALQDRVEELLLEHFSRASEAEAVTHVERGAGKLAGFYVLTNPRSQLEEFAQPLTGLLRVSVDASGVELRPVPFADASSYQFAGRGLFKRRSDSAASLAARVDADGTTVLTDGFWYYGRISLVRAAISLAALALVVLALTAGPLIALRDMVATRRKASWGTITGLAAVVQFPVLIAVSVYLLLALRETLDAYGWQASALFAVTVLVVVMPIASVVLLLGSARRRQTVMSTVTGTVYPAVALYMVYSGVFRSGPGITRGHRTWNGRVGCGRARSTSAPYP